MRLLLLAALVGGVTLAGCHSSKKTTGNGDMAMMMTGGDMAMMMTGGDMSMMTGLDFEDYVIGLIKNHTNDTDVPDDYTMAGITYDSQDPSKFTPIF